MRNCSVASLINRIGKISCHQLMSKPALFRNVTHVLTQQTRAFSCSSRRFSAVPEPVVDAVCSEYIDHEPSLDDTIYVAMSGGVDSSTTAALLRKKAPLVTGILC